MRKEDRAQRKREKERERERERDGLAAQTSDILMKIRFSYI